MAYIKTVWTDRVVQFVRRYRDQNNNQLTLTPDEGTITNVGTPVTAQRMNNIENGIANAMPAGGIIMWSGSVASIPATWALCDGANGTPDLRNRFIVGAGSTYTPGNTGGADTVALSSAQMPSHNHSFSATSGAAGTHDHRLPVGPDINGGAFGADPSQNRPYYTFDSMGLPTEVHTETGGSHTHSVSGTSGSTGSGTAHENRPPYFALAYIMKL